MEKKLTVHHFNTSMKGGAAIAAKNVHESLLGQGYDSVFISMSESKPQATYIACNPHRTSLLRKPWHSIKARIHYKQIAKLLSNKPQGYEQFSVPTSFVPTPYSFFYNNLPDIIHLHWITDWIDLRSFFNSIPSDIPIVWTLHDMWAFTGGCHHAWECVQFKSRCQQCPQLSDKNQLSVADFFQLKQLVYKHKNLHVIGNSNWTTEQAKQSALFRSAKSIQTIHLGVDTELFKPIPNRKRESKTIKIGFSASYVHIRGKGLALLLHALEAVFKQHSNIELLIAGKHDYCPQQNYPVKCLGSLNLEEMIEFYNEIDFFVSPSYNETFGQTVVESMSCGTPVIASNVGGQLDTVFDQETGLFFESGSIESLVKRIHALIDNPKMRNVLGENGHLRVKAMFDIKHQLAEHKKMYRGLLEA